MSNKARTFDKFIQLLVDANSDDREGTRRLIQMLADFMTGDQFEEFYQHCLEEIEG
jgi:hypothetical protein